jgi:hypothetical protein
VAGFGSALAIYLTAAVAPANPLGYEPGDSRRYLREMEVYGGRANVVAGEIREWFGSLWHGRRLAGTVVFMTLLLLLLFLIASTPLPPASGPASEPTKDSESTDP